MHLLLAVPQLLTADPAGLARLPGLAGIAAYSRAPRTEPAGLDTALAAAAGLPRDVSIAQLAALGAGYDPGATPVLFADPVTFVAGRDDVLLRGRVDDLTEGDAQNLVRMLNHHFAADGVVFHAPRADAWFLTADAARALVTTPLAAISGAIHPHFPRGGEAKSWRRWLSEMQMLLHEMPVNDARVLAGQAPVTGIWIWGGGEDARGALAAAAAWWAPPGRPGDVARGIARLAGLEAHATPASLAALPAVPVVHAVLPPIRDLDAAQAVDRAWLAPAAQALTTGSLAALTLLADSGRMAHVWHATPPDWSARLRQRLAPRPFFVPAPDIDA